MHQSEFPQPDLRPDRKVVIAPRRTPVRPVHLSQSVAIPAQTGRDPAPIVAIALGSNRPHGRFGRPPAVVMAAAEALHARGLPILCMSPVIATAPIGPSRRQFANAALTTRWPGDPVGLLRILKDIERAFGRRPGRRWGPRVLDLDILLIGDHRIDLPALTVPHRDMAARRFVLAPLAAVLPDWHHPKTGLSTRQMLARLGRRHEIAPDGQTVPALAAG